MKHKKALLFLGWPHGASLMGHESQRITGSCTLKRKRLTEHILYWFTDLNRKPNSADMPKISTARLKQNTFA